MEEREEVVYGSSFELIGWLVCWAGAYRNIGSSQPDGKEYLERVVLFRMCIVAAKQTTASPVQFG
jgi:hypothetical protein